MSRCFLTNPSTFPMVKTLLPLTLAWVLLVSGCAQKPVATTLSEETHAPLVASLTPASTFSISAPQTPTENQWQNDYQDCGAGTLIEVPYFFKDQGGTVSPTQIIRSQVTSDNVRRYVSVISCLKFDDGWESDPDEVENGYENEIEFFDKFGKGHSYRIIMGGHYIAPYDPIHKDITASVDGVTEQYFTLDDWMATIHNAFVSHQSRQIGVNIYLDDTQGNLSKVLKQTHQFRETNLQIESALKTGEGYPETVPDGFFLFATESWLINPE